MRMTPLDRLGLVPRSTSLRRSRRVAAAIFALCLGGTANAGAAAGTPDETAAVPDKDLTALSIETLLGLNVYSASRFEQKRSEAPSAVIVITAAEIRDFGWRTLDQLLASLPGLYTSYDRSYAYLGTRGFLRPGDYDTRFLLMVNGNRVNDPLYDQAPIGTDFVLDMDVVDRVEYVPGPGSSGYGSNAFFGVINVITRGGRDYPRAEARVELGSNGHTSLAARYGHVGESGEFLLAASGFDVEGADLYFPEYDTPDTNGGVAAGLDGDRARRFLLTGNYGAFSVSMLHAVRTKHDPAASFQQLFNDPRSFNRDERTLLDLGYTARTAADLDVTAHLFAGRYAYDGEFIYEPIPGPTNIDGGRAVWAGFGAQAVSTAWERHKLVFGVDAQYDIRRDLFNYYTPPRESVLDEHSTNHHVGVFVEDEFRLGQRLLLNAGVRLDHDGVTGVHLNPRLALIYSGERNNFKAIAGTAYRSPNFYETGYTTANFAGAADVDAERIGSSELVWTRTLGAHTTVTGSLFSYRLTDLIDEQTNPDNGQLFFANRGKVTTHGAELAVDHVWDSGAMMRASYSHARAQDVDGDAALQNSPHNLAKVNFSTPVPGTHLRVGIEGRYVDSRLAEFGSVDAYRLVNATLTWSAVSAPVEISATVRNVFDQRYADPVGPAYVQNGLEQDGRSYVLRLVYRF